MSDTSEDLKALAERWDKEASEIHREPGRVATVEGNVLRDCASELRTALSQQQQDRMRFIEREGHMLDNDQQLRGVCPVCLREQQQETPVAWMGFSDEERESFPATAEMMARLEKRLCGGRAWDADFHEASKRVRALVGELLSLRGRAPSDGCEAERHAFVEGYMARVDDEGGEGDYTEFFRGKAADAWHDWSGEPLPSPPEGQP